MMRVENVMFLLPNKIKLGVLVVSLLIAAESSAQVTITAADMFNKTGLYYRAYMNASDTAVSGFLGKPGGSQAWDFTKGPTDQILRFDYVPIDQSPFPEAFPNAKTVERKLNESDGSLAWLFFEQVPGRGRKVYGFFDPEFGIGSNASVFTAPIFDFPETINMNDSWTTSVSFISEIGLSDSEIDPEDPLGGGGFSFSIPLRINLSSSFKADAYGIVNQPGVGFGDALRINELQTISIDADLTGDGQFDNVSLDFVRTYYWLRPGLGIAVQITSIQQTTPPPDEFSTAIAFLRTFETNHPKGEDRPIVNGVTGLKASYGGDRVLLNWNTTANITTYAVEYTENIGDPGSWMRLGETKSNFMIDPDVRGKTVRYYRIVGVN